MQGTNGTLELGYVTELVKAHYLSSAFIAQFSGFELSARDDGSRVSIQSPVAVAEIRGVPKTTLNALDGLGETMLASESSMLYQAWAHPTKPSYFARIFTERRLRAALDRSQKQTISDGWLTRGETRTKHDVKAAKEARRLEEVYERLTSNRILDCRVVLASWGSPDCVLALRAALSTLMGTISHSSKKKMLQTRIFSGKHAERILTGILYMKPMVRGTQMLPREAVPLFEIPHIEMGLVQGSMTSFSTAGTQPETNSGSLPRRENQIALGRLYRTGRLHQHQAKYVPLEDLRRHVAVLGMTGSGKTSTKHRIVIDAWDSGVPSLLVEPIKTDSRVLLGAIDSLRVFTAGRETVAPFRLNPFFVDEGVPVQSHIDQLYFSFLAAWPLYGILANHLRKVIVRTYVHNGWDILTDAHGRQVSLEDFRAEAESYSGQLQYGSELKQDFRGAILTRVEDLCDPSRAAIFNTTTNLSVAELLRFPTILELGHIKDPEFKALLLNLLLFRIEQYFDSLGPASHLRNLILIDEAHRFLKELPPTLDVSETAVSKRQAQDRLEDLTAEARSVGIGIVVLDQDPSQLSRRVLKNCHTKIVHRLESPDDIQLVGHLLKCDEHQRNRISDMREGEAIVRGLHDTAPLNLQIFYDPDFNPEMKPHWTDAEVRERMGGFYEEHVEFAKTPEIPSMEPASHLEDRETIAMREQVVDIVTSSGYEANYIECVSEPDAEKMNALEELVVFYATRTISTSLSPLEVVSVFIEATIETYGPPPYPFNPVVIQQLLKEQERPSKPTEDRGDLSAA